MISHDIHPPIPILRWSSWVSWDDDLPGTWRRGKVWLPPASMKRVPSIAPRIGFGTNGLAFLFFRWIRVNSGFYIWLVVTGTWLDSDFPETVGNGNSSQLTHIFQRDTAQPPTSDGLSWLISLDFFSAKFVFSWWLIWLVHTYEIIWTCMNMQFVCVMYTFWSSNMAMGNSPFIDDFPNFNGHLRGCPSQPYFITGDYIPILIPVIVNINHR